MLWRAGEHAGVAVWHVDVEAPSGGVPHKAAVVALQHMTGT
jgi:hypothetical protein